MADVRAAAFDTVERIAKDNIPVIGHVGLIPHFCTWTGGFKAVGKTAESAMQVYERCKRYEEVGAFGLEVEVVPPEFTAEIAKRTNLFLVSMGGGPGGDCQYLFACDVLGTTAAGVSAGSFIDAISENIDLCPTFTDIASTPGSTEPGCPGMADNRRLVLLSASCLSILGLVG